VHSGILAHEDSFRSLFGAMNEMVMLGELVLDEADKPVDYRIIDCNDAFIRGMGIERDTGPENTAPGNTVQGKTGSSLFKLKPPPYLDLYAEVTLTGISRSYLDQYSIPDRFLSVSVICPRPGAFATITGDISEIMGMKEALLAKNRELEKYLYIASHDLRSPLVNIQGFSTRLRKQTLMIGEELDRLPLDGDSRGRLDGILTSEIPKSLDFIFTNVNKMDKLISGLLQISRTGRLSLSVRKIDMNALIKTVLDSLAFETEQARAVMTLESLEPCFGDEQLLSQLFANLIGNAIKYRDPERPLRIHMECKQERRNNIYSIRDTGVGIDKRHLERIWDVFYRADWVNGPPGDGIGLSLVKRIVEKHKGKATLESVKGEGSVFHIALPAEMFVEDE